MTLVLGTPAQFIAGVLSGVTPAASAVVGATQTDFQPVNQTTPQIATMLGVGNSLTLDYFGQMTGRLGATQALLHPGRVWDATNLGVGGAWTTDLAATFAATSARYYSPFRRCVLHFCELTNHIGAGATFVTARDAATAYCATARAAGWFLVFHIPTPRAERTDPGYAASASAWRTGQKDVYDQCVAYFRTHPEHYNAVVDLAAVLPDPHDTAMYLADGCHCTQAGQDAKASAVAAASVGF